MLLSSASFSDNSWKYFSHINKFISHFTLNSFTFQGRIFHNLFINNPVRDIPQLLFSFHVWHNFLSTIFIHISLNVWNDEEKFFLLFSTFCLCEWLIYTPNLQWLFIRREKGKNNIKMSINVPTMMTRLVIQINFCKIEFIWIF